MTAKESRLDSQVCIELAPKDETICIAQITDTHLEEAAGGALLGMDTDNSLSHVLKLLEQKGGVDLVLATGDIANHGSMAAYQRFLGYTAALPFPVCWLMGNHDDAQLMTSAAGKPIVRRILIGAWQIVLLDSTVPGEVGGRLDAAELRLLHNCLEEYPEQHTLVVLHHHPVPIGCDWLDEQQVENAEELFAIIDKQPNARGLLWGHVHQQYDALRGQCRLLCSPSTCVQFAANSSEFKTDDVAPGYRWLELHKDGRIETQVERVAGVVFDYDHDSTGYE